MNFKAPRMLYGLLIAIVFILPLVFLGSGFFASASDKILPGVEVMGVKMDGLNRSEGVDRLVEVEKNLRATRIVLKYQDRAWPLLLNEIGLDLDEEAILNEALKAGRQGSLVKRWQERQQLKAEGMNLEPSMNFDRKKLVRRVEELTRDITIAPKEATFQVNIDDTVSVLPSADGSGVDIDRLEKEIVRIILSGKKPEVNLVLIPVPPSRSTELLESMNVNGLLGSYSTRFDPTKVSRTYNVSVASKAVDELLVRPGHEVSFNKVVGPRSSEAGYKNAPVIINNEFVDGIGGGVCQVSTTLYNAVLLANLDIVERSYHSLPISYVPIGRDATVVYDSIDFKFRNNTDSYIYIKSLVKGGQLTVKIYGDLSYKRDVTINTWVTQSIDPKVVYENDPNLPKGEKVVKQEGAKGFKVAAERIVKYNGVVEKKEKLSSSDYQPVNKVIAVGTMNQVLPQIAPSTPSLSPGEENNPNDISDQTRDGVSNNNSINLAISGNTSVRGD